MKVLVGVALASVLMADRGSEVCRYTVRDIGFLLRDPDPATTLVLRPAAGDREGDSDDAVRLTLRARDAGLAVDLLAPVDALPETAFLRHAGRPDLVLHERLRPVGAESLPAATEHALAAAWDSPLTRTLVDEALDTFAFVLMVESDDGEANGEVHGLVDEAVARLGDLEEHLPRPIDRPTRTLVIDAERRDAERLLLWGLGVDSFAEPTVAVVYGRAKLAGPVLSGEALTRTELVTQLALIGESCECETNRAWASEPHLPLEWTQEQRERASSQLGFEPESPMVQAEVARILAKGPHDRERGIGGERPDTIEEILFGVREQDLVSGVSEIDPDRVEDTEAASGAGSTPTGLQILDAGEGDWDFFEPGPVQVEPLPEDRPDGKGGLAPIINHGTPWWRTWPVLGGLAFVLVLASLLLGRSRSR